MHLSPGKLMKLINSAAEHWKKNEKLKIYFRNIGDDCKIGQIYRKSPARPAVVGLKNVYLWTLNFVKGKPFYT